MKKFDEKISVQNAKIEKLESITSIHENAIDQLLIKCDDNKQYSGRSCLPIHGVEVKEKESEGDVMNTLEQCYSSLDVPFDPNDIDQAHHIGLSYIDNHSGKKIKSITANFRSRKTRQLSCKSRPSYHNVGWKKPGFSVSIDLTKAKGPIKGNTNISYVYGDINCSLALRFKDNCFKYFNSEKELHHLLNN